MAELVPEWVRVWAWYRQTHPTDRRPFPQQLHTAGEECVDYAEVLAAYRRLEDPPVLDFGAIVDAA